MILDVDISSDLIVAARIWPASTNGRGLRRFNLDGRSLNDALNGLLLHRSIEKAFDRKQICFVFDSTNNQLKLKIVCPQARNKEIVTNITFQSIDGKPLKLPVGIWPFRRLLNWHAIRAYEYELITSQG